MVYLKLLVLWGVVIVADYFLEFRFEYLWPFWLFLRSVYDSFKYQGLVSLLFNLTKECFFSEILCASKNILYIQFWKNYTVISLTLGSEMFAQGGLFMEQNAYVQEGRNERGREATHTSILIFDSYDMKTL